MLKNKVLLILFISMAFGLLACSESADSIITKAIKPRGDVAGQNDIKSIAAELKAANMGFDITMKINLVPPDKIRMDLNLLGQRVTTVINGNAGWMKSDTILQPLPAEQIAENKKVIGTQMNFFRSELIGDKEKSIKTELMGDDTLEGKKVFKIKMISKDSIEKIVFIDKSSYLQLKTMETQKFQGMKSISESFFRNYKEVQGFMVPHVIEMKQNGSPAGKLTITNIKFNEKLSPMLFEKPEMK